MSFSDITRKIKAFYTTSSTLSNQTIKETVKYKTLNTFRAQKRERKRTIIALWRYRFSFAFSLFFIVGMIGFLQSSLRDQQLLAGEIQPMVGPVEIIRGKESLLVEDPVDIFIGDIIKTGTRGEVKISIPNEFTSIAKNRTQFRITNKKTLFLDKGVLENKTQRSLEVATDRGFIKGASGSEFQVSVSDSGETEVLPHKNVVQIFDLWDGKLDLNPGETVKLRSDTRLTNKTIPDDLKLSNAQIRAIKSKLTIARTKIVTGVQHSTMSENQLAVKDFESAKKTFTSLTQVLKTSRELEIARRKNLKQLSTKDVYPEMKERLENETLLSEIKAIEILFDILSQNKDQLAFSPQNSDVEAFNRYVILKRLIDLGTPEQQDLSRLLLHKYVVNFLQKIQNKEVRIEQIAMLDAQIDKLPKNKTARKFLYQVRDLFSEEFAKIVDEKIRYRF